MNQVKQSTATNLPVYLRDSSTGNPKTGVAAGDVSAFYVKQGQTTETSKTVVGNWTEIDATNMPGIYTLAFTAGELDTLGVFMYTVKGTGIKQFDGMVQVVEYLPADLLQKIEDEDAEDDARAH